MKIAYLDLKRQYKTIKPEVNKAIQTVLNSQFFILGNEGKLFEKEFCDYLGCRFAVGVNSGTDALTLSLLALGIGKGDEVITTPFSFISTALAITEVGATPVFADINPDTYQIDVDQIEKKITRRTKVILPVHLYGAPCQIDRIIKIARAKHLFVIEDAAQAHGSKLHNKKVGTFGNLAIFSFYPGKNLGAYGDGGMVTTNNKTLYERLLRLRNCGMKKRYYHELLGRNSRLDEMQAAVLRVKLKCLDTWNRERNRVAKTYKKYLRHIKTQSFYDGTFSNYHLFVIETSRRAALQNFLKKKGVVTLIHYPIPIHLQECYRSLNYHRGDFKNAESVSSRILSLPMYPELKEKEIKYICRLINSFHFSNQKRK